MANSNTITDNALNSHLALVQIVKALDVYIRENIQLDINEAVTIESLFDAASKCTYGFAKGLTLDLESEIETKTVKAVTNIK